MTDKPLQLPIALLQRLHNFHYHKVVSIASSKLQQKKEAYSVSLNFKFECDYQQSLFQNQ